MKRVVVDHYGGPEVLRVVEEADPRPGPGEVRVRMILSPINPSDTMVVEGRYGVLPTLPATPNALGCWASKAGAWTTRPMSAPPGTRRSRRTAPARVRAVPAEVHRRRLRDKLPGVVT